MTEKADRAGVKSSAVSHLGDMPGSSPKSEGDPDFSQLFSRFEAFKFDSDPQFQAGLSRIIGNTNVGKAREHAVDFLKIKAFYYSRNVEPLDFTAYMDWRQKQGTGMDESQTRQTDHSSAKDKNNPDQPITPHNQGFGPDSHSPYDAQTDSVSKRIHEMSPSTPCMDDKEGDSQCLSGAQNNDTSHARESVDPHISFSQEISSCSTEAEVITINNMMSAASIAEDSGQGVNQPVKKVEQIDKDTICSHVGTDQNCDSTEQQPGVDTVSTDHNLDADVLKQSRQTDLHIFKDEQKSESMCDPDKKASAGTDGRQKELSFAEVAELIQSGKPIPGLAQIEVVPTNVAPTPSRLHRVKKPWEQ